MTQEEIEEFAIQLTDKCPTHQEWLLVVRFGMGTLLANPQLLTEIVFREADRLAKQCPSSFTSITAAVTICDELNLRFECTPTEE